MQEKRDDALLVDQPPVWNSPVASDDRKAYRAKALAYLKHIQKETKKKSAACGTKYQQMTQTELEDVFEDLKEKIEYMTINSKAEVGEAVELQEEVSSFCEVLRAKCDKVKNSDALLDLKRDVKNWMGNHLMYVMAIRDEYIALKTALMQICQDASK